MNDLTIALASLGGVVLAGVIAHGAWQARRAGPKQASDIREEPKAHDGRGASADGRASRGAGRPGTEPGFGEPSMADPAGHPMGEHDDGAASAGAPGTAAAALDRAAASGDATSAFDGDAGLGSDAAAALAPPRRLARQHVKVDALIDAIATVSLEAPVSAEQLAPVLSARRFVGSKLVVVEGLDSESGQWEAPAPGHRYGELQAGVQLASRTGPLNEIEFSEFVQRVEAIALGTGGAADIPDMLDAMARAKELDAFASQHDAQLAVHLRARGTAWSVGYVQQQARRAGFVPGVVAGRLVYPSADEGAPPILALTFDAQAALADDPERAVVRDATLQFDVPQTDPAGDPFRTWQASAQALAAAMDADIVDDDGRVLSADAFASIGGELGQLYQALSARDLGAGSAAARRLFS